MNIPSRRRILTIEDDAAIRRGIVDALRFAGYDTFEAGEGEAGLEMAVSIECELVLLDLVLPGRDGLSILEQVRAVRPTLPVIILTARGEEADRVRGLKLGADDYVVKPFSIKELLARVEAVLRRSVDRPGNVREVKLAGLTLDFDRCEVRFDDGARADLSEREVELLRHLASRAGQVVTRAEIMARVWRIDPAGVATRTIDMHVARLREKLRDPADQPRLIRTVRGRGYLFTPEADGDAADTAGAADSASPASDDEVSVDER